MKSNRFGRNRDLRIHIRLALLDLGQDPHQYDDKRMSTAELEALLKKLRRRQEADPDSSLIAGNKHRNIRRTA